MRKHFVYFILTPLLLFALAPDAAAARIISLKGEAVYLPEGGEDWEPAAVEQELSSGDTVRTLEESWVQLRFIGGHSSRLGPESSIQIDSIDDDILLDLIMGEVLSKVSELPEDGKFEISSPQAVTAVRGTSFSVSVNEQDDETLVRVFEGSVFTREPGTGEEVEVPAGMLSRVRRGTPPSEPEELSADEGDPDLAWADDPDDDGEEPEDTEDPEDPETVEEPELAESDPEPDPEPDAAPARPDVRQELRQTLRGEIRRAVSEIRTDVNASRDVVEKTRETDVSVGRTMRDFHGNLVRVEQHVIRPRSDTLQFVNITKRDNYRYRGRMEVEGTGARLDSFETRVSFSRDIPRRLSGWVNFLSDMSDTEIQDFHPTSMEIRISNQVDSINVRSDRWIEEDEELEEPTITFVSGKHGTWQVDTDPPDSFQGGDGIDREPDEGRIAMWAISPRARLHQPGNKNILFNGDSDVRIGIEGWLINNDGRVIGTNDLSSGNPFDTMKRVAFELSGTVRYGFDTDYILNDPNVENTAGNRDKALAGFNEASNFFDRNFDIVATPDFLYNALEEMARNIDFDALDSDD